MPFQWCHQHCIYLKMLLKEIENISKNIKFIEIEVVHCQMKLDYG